MHSPRIQIMSDLHLEVGNQYSTFRIPPAAPYLILAGDIGRLKDYEKYLGFVKTQCEQFKHVYLVFGNHEFYGKSRQEGLDLAGSLEQESVIKGKLSVLNRKRINLHGFPNIVILGYTLQSQIPPESVEIVKSRIKDFQRIEGWTVEQRNAEHARDTEWLMEQITSLREDGHEDSQKKIVVVTHYAPCLEKSSRPEHGKNAWNCAFGTDLLGSLDYPNFSWVHWWIFGHTHYTTSFTNAGIKVISNQRGYSIAKPTDITPSWKRLFQMDAWGVFRKDSHNFDLRTTIKI